MLRTLMLGLLLVANLALASADDDLFPVVVMETSKGTIKVELNRRSAPLTVAHFLELVKSGAYDNTIFHRVIKEFVIQGGGLDSHKVKLADGQPVVNESGNGLSNIVGTIAMARQNDPHSATRQFYFNIGDNANLDPQPGRWGYTVFGQVSEGMEVLTAISEVPTTVDPLLGWPDVPVEAVILKRVYIATAP